MPESQKTAEKKTRWYSDRKAVEAVYGSAGEAVSGPVKCSAG